MFAYYNKNNFGKYNFNLICALIDLKCLKSYNLLYIFNIINFKSLFAELELYVLLCVFFN